MELTLIRQYFPSGTNGMLWLGGRAICATIELPWKQNQENQSCIPEGRYELEICYSPEFGNHFKILDVPERMNILIRPFNHGLTESRGCIAPVSSIVGEGRGTFSRVMLEKLTALLYPHMQEDKPVFLTVSS